jgi:hypothetical protein
MSCSLSCSLKKVKGFAMNDENRVGVHWSFWAIGAVALIWNAMGGINFVMQMNPETLASMPESHRAIAEARPAWASAAFAVSVFGGALGCVLLLLRKKVSYYLFIASFLGVIVTMTHALGMAGSAFKFGPFELVLGVVMPIVVATFLIWYSKRAQTKAWIS